MTSPDKSPAELDESTPAGEPAEAAAPKAPVGGSTRDDADAPATPEAATSGDAVTGTPVGAGTGGDVAPDAVDASGEAGARSPADPVGSGSGPGADAETGSAETGRAENAVAAQDETVEISFEDLALTAIASAHQEHAGPRTVPPAKAPAGAGEHAPEAETEPQGDTVVAAGAGAAMTAQPQAAEPHGAAAGPKDSEQTPDSEEAEPAAGAASASGGEPTSDDEPADGEPTTDDELADGGPIGDDEPGTEPEPSEPAPGSAEPAPGFAGSTSDQPSAAGSGPVAADEPAFAPPAAPSPFPVASTGFSRGQWLADLPTPPAPTAPVPPPPFPGPATALPPVPPPPITQDHGAPYGTHHGDPHDPASSAAVWDRSQDYAAAPSYAGWDPASAAEEKRVRRRRLGLAGAALAGIAVIVVVISLIVDATVQRGWEPIPADIAQPQDVNSVQLVLGSCLDRIPLDGEVDTVRAVPCDVPHEAQVVGRTDFGEDTIWPGADAAGRKVAQVCGAKQLSDGVRRSDAAKRLRYVVWTPSEESWDDGDRVGLCVAASDTALTKSLLT